MTETPVSPSAIGPPSVLSPPGDSGLNDATYIEIRAIFEKEDSQLAEIWRRTQAGETADQIKEAFGNAMPNFVWNYTRTARAILDGDLPTAPTVSLSAARTLRRMLKQYDFTPATKRVLEERLTVLENNAASPEAKNAEVVGAQQATSKAEDNAIPGVYVYALPHYLRHPYDEESGRTLLKVGMANRSVIKRFRDQIRTTALPEDPVLLRVYPCAEKASQSTEAKFHRLLVAADHDRSKARTGGTEWFLSSTKFLDEIASSFGLEVHRISDLADSL